MIETIKLLFRKIRKGIIVAFLILFVFTLISNIFIGSIQKDSKSLQQNNNLTLKMQNDYYQEIDRLQTDKQNSQENKVMIGFYKSSMCVMVGDCANGNKTGSPTGKGLFGFIGQLMTIPYMNPPASGSYYVYSSLQRSGFISKAYAAEGIGFAALKPFADIWRIFRNVAYLFIVIILIAMGFMIMFRMKLNPQTVISIENSIPKIILALILITFSYAIAGFLIDLMYVFIALIISILGNSNKFFNIFEFQNKYITATPGLIDSSLYPLDFKTTPGLIPPFLRFINDLFGINLRPLNNLWTISDTLLSILPESIKGFVYIIGVATTLIITKNILGLLGADGANITTAFNGLTGATFGWGNLPSGITGTVILIAIFSLIITVIFPLIIALLISFTILLLFIRIFFMLLMAYIKIILLILFAPILLIFEAIPGQQAFSYWIRNLIGEILTFPVTITIFLLGYLIVNNSFSGTAGATPLTPPFLYGINSSALVLLMGMGLIYLTPEIVALVKNFLGLKPSPVGVGPGVFFAGTTVAISGAMGLANQFYTISRITEGLGGGATARTTALQQWLARMTGGQQPGGQQGTTP